MRTHPDDIAVSRRLGISVFDAKALRLAGRTLHRWAEGECGDSNGVVSWCIVRDETTGKPYREVHPNTGPSYREPIRDREKGALRRVARICAYHKLDFFHQTDPRGSALYVAREPLTNTNYSSIGVAV